jgi:hypothetical protein
MMKARHDRILLGHEEKRAMKLKETKSSKCIPALKGRDITVS